MIIMKEFERWISHRKESHKQLLDQNIRLDAFRVTIATQKRMAAFDFVVKAFDLNHEGNDYFVPCVKIYILNGKFKEVGNLGEMMFVEVLLITLSNKFVIKPMNIKREHWDSIANCRGLGQQMVFLKRSTTYFFRSKLCKRGSIYGLFIFTGSAVYKSTKATRSF